MSKKISAILLFIFSITLLLSCTDVNTKDSLIEGSFFNASSLVQTFKNRVSSPATLNLSIPEYWDWIKDHKGETYDEENNEKIQLSIVYKPLVLEAALSAALSGEMTEKSIKKYEKLKKGYHYFELECLWKDNSVVNPLNKNLLLETIRKNIFACNNADTLSNLIIELFPSSIVNQPHKLIMLMENTGENNISAGIKGQPLGVRDIKITITKEQIKTFPKIKI